MKKRDKKISFKRASEDVRELERYIKEFSTFLPLPVCLINSSKVIIDVNSAFLEFSSYLEGEIMGQKVEKLFAKNKIINIFLKKLFKEKKILRKEIEFLNKNNESFIVNLFASPRKNYQNKIVGYFLAVSDIDELKKLQNNLEGKVKERTKELQKTHDALLQTLEEVNVAKAEIEKEQRRTGAILSNFLDPVVVVDNDYKIIFLNPASEKIFGPAKETLGKKLKSKNKRFSFQDFQGIVNQKFDVREVELDKNQHPAVEEVIIYSDEEKEEESPFSASLSKKEKENIVYKVLTATVCDEKNICFGRMKLFYDLTREKMIDKMKTEFISIAAHQLRTPLSATKWAIRMVVDGDVGEVTENQKEILMKGYISNERVIGLINDMLYVSKIEEGRFGYVFGIGDIGEILDKIFNEQREEIKNKSINLKIKKPDVIQKISLDKEKLELALRNIIENSIRYTPENGKVEITVKEKNKELKISIKDNGVGIPEDEQKKLFTKFFRGENVVRMQTEGSGLGLFIVKNIIEKHNGKIEIKSEEGNGTEVILTLPLIKK